MHRRALTLALVVAGAVSMPASADGQTGFVNLPFMVDGQARTAALWVPADYDPTVPWPLVIFLHSMSGWGDNDGDATGTFLDEIALVPAIRAHPERFPALVLIPRCPPFVAWAPIPADAERADWHRQNTPDGDVDAAAHVDAAWAQVVERYSVDPERVTLTGFSIGGDGALRYAAARADRLAAIAPVAGFGAIVTSDAAALAGLPIWAFQGERDFVSTPELARTMIEAIEDAGGDVRYTEYPAVEHLIADRAYGDAALIAWLLEQRRQVP